MAIMSHQHTKIKFTSTEDGIHLDGSILWLDSQYTRDLSFLSNAHMNQGRFNSRVVATEETLKILEIYRKKPQALICQYNHPFAIGPLGMELLPSGVGLGGASLWVITKDKNIFYAPYLQAHRTEVARQMQIRPADVMVISAKKPYSSQSSHQRKNEKEAILTKILSLIQLNQRPIVLCEAFPTAQELTKLFSEEGITPDVFPTIHRINKIYEDYGLPLGKFNQLSSHSKGEVIILPISKYQWNTKKPLPQGPVINVFDATHHQQIDSIFRKPVANFLLPSSCEGVELKEIISEVSPQVLYIFGPYAKDYAKHLKHTAPTVTPLFPSHLPSLF